MRFLILAVLFTCKPDPGHIELTLDRDGRDIVVETRRVHTGRLDDVDLVASVGTVGDPDELDAGVRRWRVTPPDAAYAFEVEITATAPSVSEQRVAVVLPELFEGLGQAEAVPGLVNTAGTEDSPEISPDGEWLIVSSYSPVDLICCLLGDVVAQCPGGEGSSTENPACNTAIGPYDGWERPDMPGADRILDGDIDHVAPAIGITEEIGVAIPPVAAYGFRIVNGLALRPFPIALDIDGFTTAPFGFSFLEAPSGGSASLVFAYGIPDSETDADVFLATTDALGDPWDLGTLELDGEDVVAVWDGVTPVATDPLLGAQGNPAYRDDTLWFDDETSVDPDIRFAMAGSAPIGDLSPSQVAGFCTAAAETQPHFDEVDGALYFAEDFTRVRRVALTGADPAASSSWAPAETLLGLGAPATDPGGLTSIGEPSIARDAEGVQWLYFAYYAVREGGLDGSIGRVRFR